MIPESYAARLARVIELANNSIIIAALRGCETGRETAIVNTRNLKAVAHEISEAFLREVARLDEKHEADALTVDRSPEPGEVWGFQKKDGVYVLRRVNSIARNGMISYTVLGSPYYLRCKRGTWLRWAAEHSAEVVKPELRRAGGEHA